MAFQAVIAPALMLCGAILFGSSVCLATGKINFPPGSRKRTAASCCLCFLLVALRYTVSYVRAVLLPALSVYDSDLRELVWCTSPSISCFSYNIALRVRKKTSGRTLPFIELSRLGLFSLTLLAQ